MATMKSYTDIEQSKKLAEILPLESADMYYFSVGLIPPIKLNVGKVSDVTESKRCWTILCWSLAALLDILPEYNLQRTDWGNKTEYKIVVTVNEDNYASKNYDNPLDACVEMIIKLHDLNLL